MTLPPLREVIARHGLSATKALGQNFLLDEQLLGKSQRSPATSPTATCSKSAPALVA
jgi:16S rRNA (adenine1518-N6/adenine1519-N6)-dimethyltransferase